MNVKRVLIFIAGCLALAACRANPVPPPPTNPNSPTVLVPFTPNSQDLELPTLLPTVTIPPTVVPVTVTPILVTVTPSPTPTRSIQTTRAPTRVPNTATPAVSPTPLPNDVPKVFITALRVEPGTPKPDQGGTYFATFQNNSGADQTYDWCVEIWEAENTRRPFGLTSCQQVTMPVGGSNFSQAGWTVKGLGECRAFKARAVARDENDTRAPFIQPDGNILWIYFNVCP
ncbi:MAG TPA: hypothetical protein VFD70_28075 [Anaerolineae bacterium]|nr:hypothetical protein [Anaerolineae bacterium]